MTSINESSHTTEPTISAETAAHIARFRQMEEEALPWVEMIENGTITEEDFRSMMAHAHHVSYLYNKILLTIIYPDLKLENLSEQSLIGLTMMSSMQPLQIFAPPLMSKPLLNVIGNGFDV